MTQETGIGQKGMVGLLSFFAIGSLLGVFLLYVFFRLVYRGHIYPSVYVGEVKVGGLSYRDAKQKIEEKISSDQIKLSFGGYSWNLPKEYVEYQVEETLNQAYRFGRRIVLKDFVAILMKKEEKLPAKVLLDVAKINNWIDTIAPSVEVVPTETTIELERGKIKISNGSDGTLIDRDNLLEKIKERASNIFGGEVEVLVRDVKNQLSPSELELLQKRAEKIVGAKLELMIEEEITTLEQEAMIAMLAKKPNSEEVWDKNAIAQYTNSLASTYNRESVNARFVIANLKAKEFAPSKDGILVLKQQTNKQIQEALEKILAGEKVAKLEVPIEKTKPTITIASINELGIEEMIGRGESYYANSIPSRVHNVALTASKITGTIVPPGQEFSFNKILGEVSRANGFEPAYVIRNGRTELGDGGGVCQVSTTIFRAAMNAGLPISERWAHSYRVGYYEQKSDPGLDATVFAPGKDFRFVNDTGSHILLQIINDPKNFHLIVEIYGKKDGRVSEVSKVRVWGQTPPPPDLYQDDPSLPLGKIKQVDWAAWGAKTTFDYKVTRDGETIFAKTFTSTYKPWQNVYLRGTKVD